MEGFQQTKTFKKKYKNLQTFLRNFAFFSKKKLNEAKFSHNFGFLFKSELFSRKFCISYFAKILHFFAKQIEAKFPRKRFFLFAENPTPPPCLLWLLLCISWYGCLCGMCKLVFSSSLQFIEFNICKHISLCKNEQI